MSVLNIGLNDISEQAQAFKDKLASKDGHIAAQDARLAKQTAEIDDLRATLNAITHQLSQETDRVLELESSLKTRAEDLRNEKITSQNITQALAITQQQVKEKEWEARELQSHLETLSRMSDGHSARCGKLEQEKAKLEAHVRNLQANLQQFSTAAPVTTPDRRFPARPRSSSVSDIRMISLEQELNHLRGLINQRDIELERANEKFIQVHQESIRVENEMLALEKKTAREISDLKLSLEEKDEELEFLQRDHHNGSRERELMERIEEDSAKIAALERMVGECREIPRIKQALRQAEEDLRRERKQIEMDERQRIALTTQKEEAVNELENAHRDVEELKERLQARETQIHKLETISQGPNLPVITEPISGTSDAEHVARLLAAVDRLRGERDTLRRSLSFLEAEHKFAMQVLEDSRSVSKLRPRNTDMAELQLREDTVRRQLGEKNEVLRRYNSALEVSMIVIQHMSSRWEGSEKAVSHLCASQDAVLRNLTDSQQAARHLEHRLVEQEARLATALHSLGATTAEKNVLMSQLETRGVNQQEQIACLHTAHQRVQDDFARSTMAVQILESERDSLKLQVTNLLAELEAAQEKVNKAESRYSELQFHQLSSMSSKQANQALRERITELEERVMRRTEQIGLHQHDIKRMEANMRLQEERLVEMTAELEMTASQKEAMVEDCADAREARDNALLRLEALEVDTETKLESTDRIIETLVEVVFKTVANAKNRIRDSLHGTLQLRESLDEERRQRLLLVAETDVLRKAETDATDGARQSAASLTASRDALAKTSDTLRSVEQERERLQQQVEGIRRAYDNEVAEVHSLKERLEAIQTRVAETTAIHTQHSSTFESQIQELHKAMIEKEVRHLEVVQGLQLAKEALQASLEEAQKSSSRSTDEEFTRLYKKHSDEMTEAKACLKEAQTALEDLRSSHITAVADLEASLQEAHEQQLAKEQQLAQASERLRESAEELERSQQNQVELARLQQDLDKALSTVRGLETSRDKLQVSYDELSKELSYTKKSFETREGEILQNSREAEETVKGELANIRRKYAEQTEELEQALTKSQSLTRQLQDVSDRIITNDKKYDEQLASANQGIKDAESTISQLRSEFGNTEQQLQELKDEIKGLTAEKESLQTENTSLEAEIQRSMSMQRFLESQTKESENRVSSLKTDVGRLQEKLSQSERTINAAEMNHSLQNAHHKREVAELNKQLDALKTQPNLQAALSELEERNNEMEELLRSKCVEIEANDDRVLEMLKDNKKLTSKVEALNRKVQNLQTKLAAAKAAVPRAAEGSNKVGSVSSSASLGSTVSTSLRSTAIFPETYPEQTIPTHPIPVFRDQVVPSKSRQGNAPNTHAITSTIPAQVVSPDLEISVYRAVSGPSVRHPKTPEKRPIQPTPVFKARTPERRSMLPAAPDSMEMEPPSMIGKKRRAPDDFEGCEGLPPQGFTADSVPSHEVGATTLRLRRALSNGFTPKRHQNAAQTMMPSPRRNASRSPAVIADVTNSPRGSSRSGQSSKKKSSCTTGRELFQAADLGLKYPQN